MQRYHYLHRHNKYVDYRLGRIVAWMRQLEESGRQDVRTILPSIMEYLTGSKNPLPVDDHEIIEAIADLKNLVDQWNILEDGDIAGYIYQNLGNRENKKLKGQFFTPREIVDYFIRRSIQGYANERTLKLFDPSCGSGQFLISAYQTLHAGYMRAGCRKFDAAEKVLSESLHGNDIDPVAAALARFNLKKISGINDNSIINIYNNNYIFDNPVAGDSIPPILFDLILGNPPWGSRLSAIEKRLARNLYSSTSSGINSFTLFIERSLRDLKSEGRLAFLLPEAYLNIKMHQASRKLVLETARICEIARWGEQFRNVFAPSISIIIQKEECCASRAKHIIQITAPNERESAGATLIPQAYYESSHEKIFNIHYTRKAVSLMSRINDKECFSLKNNARFFLGVVTGNNPLHIRRHESPEYPDPIIIGKDIQQYKISFSGHYFNYNPDTLQQVAPRQLYLSKGKILYKFIGRRLTFALDEEGRYSLNNVNGFLSTHACLDPAVMVALLNSAVMQYYYENNFFTVKVLRGNLERLPLKHLPSPTQKRLGSLSRTLIDEDNPDSRARCREQIEDIIFHAYGIPDREAGHIINQVNAAPSRFIPEVFPHDVELHP